MVLNRKTWLNFHSAHLLIALCISLLVLKVAYNKRHKICWHGNTWKEATFQKTIIPSVTWLQWHVGQRFVTDVMYYCYVENRLERGLVKTWKSRARVCSFKLSCRQVSENSTACRYVVSYLKNMMAGFIILDVDNLCGGGRGRWLRFRYLRCLSETQLRVNRRDKSLEVIT